MTRKSRLTLNHLPRNHKVGNIARLRDLHRAKNGYWAGPVPDMGPYPINTVRNLFGAEPVEVATATGVVDAVFVPSPISP